MFFGVLRAFSMERARFQGRSTLLRIGPANQKQGEGVVEQDQDSRDGYSDKLLYQ